MKPWCKHAILILLAAAVLGCGSKKPEETTPQPGDGAKVAEPTEAATEEEQQEQAVASAQNRIKDWLGTELAGRVSSLGKELGKGVGDKLAKDEKVHAAAGKLVGALFSDQELKKKVDRISDNATSGLGNQLKLGWKVIQAGGVNNYKKKVKEETQRIATPVLTAHVKNLLKDPRMADLLKSFGPALKMQGKIAAATVGENLSPRVSKKIFAITLRIASAGETADMASRVEEWIADCEEDAGRELEKLLRGVGELPSVAEAAQGLALEVLGHETTKRELIAMGHVLVDDSETNKKLVQVYKAAALQHGESKVRSAIEGVVALPIVDRELFATMNKLAAAEGAPDIINKHASRVSEDPKMAELAENFIINVLETCGDPTADEQ